MFFHRVKEPKRPALQKQSFCALFTSRKRHSSVAQNLPQTTFRSAIGDKRTRFPRHNNNANMHRSNSFYPVSAVWTVVCCVLDSAGCFWGLPVQENRPRTCHPERSEGSQTKGSLKIEKQSQRYQSMWILRFFAPLLFAPEWQCPTNFHCKSNFQKETGTVWATVVVSSK